VANVHFNILEGAAVNLWMVSAFSEERWSNKWFREAKTNTCQLIEVFGMIRCGRPRLCRVVVSLEVKYSNMVASKIGFGLAITIISKELSAGGK
jgi:hypothetical protein